MTNSSYGPLLHINNKTGEPKNDGTGFITQISGNLICVSCAHTFDAYHDSTTYIILNNQKYSLTDDPSLKKTENHDIKIGSTPINPIKYRHDYAFKNIQGDTSGITPIPLQNTSEVNDQQKLLIHTHDQKGIYHIKESLRYGTADKASIAEIVGPGFDVENMITLLLKDLQKGDSGSPVTVQESGKCIGFIQSGNGGRVHILKGETIETEYLSLKRH